MEECAEHLPFGQPKSPRTDTTLICRQGYALEHDDRAKIPVWVAYTLTPERALGCARRTGDWDPDPSIPPDERAVPKDYAKSGYDIGHMANNADMRWSPQVEVESNVLSNAAPQRPSLNRGPWKQLEDQTRAWALERRSPILVYTGPIYQKDGAPFIGRQVTIPRAFWKVLVDQRTRHVVAFIYPADATQGPPATFRSSLAEVQRQSGLVLPMPERKVLSRSVWTSQSKTGGSARTEACSTR